MSATNDVAGTNGDEYPVELEEDEQEEEEAQADAEEAQLSRSWFGQDGADVVDASFKDYDIMAIPNDFNVKTICDFVDSGAVKIPAFQRNYVWDLKRASKLVESVLIGLPIPQIFLYEEKRNSYLVVDGQQRLMSLYFFVKGRFPRREKRAALRRLVPKSNVLPKSLLADDEYFQKFNLSLAKRGQGSASRFHGENYDTLGEAQREFDLRVIRNIVIKQTAPKEDDGDSSVFEIFNRLNTGGVNLRPQEIRASLYHSDFMDALHEVNLHEAWRRLVRMSEPDVHAKDVEILLRSFALAAGGERYREPMSGFLNSFAGQARGASDVEVKYSRDLLIAFFEKTKAFSPEVFAIAKSGRFSIAMFEAVFRAICADAIVLKSLNLPSIDPSRLEVLKEDPEFLGATQFGIGRSSFVAARYKRARAILLSE